MQQRPKEKDDHKEGEGRRAKIVCTSETQGRENEVRYWSKESRESGYIETTVEKELNTACIVMETSKNH